MALGISSRARREPRAYPQFVPLLTAVLAVSGLALAFAVDRSVVSRSDDPWGLAPLFVLLTASGWLEVKFQWHGEIEAWDLFESVLTPIVFAFSPLVVVAVVAVAKGVSQTLLRVSPLKAAFNVAQWAFAAAVGSAIFSALRDGNQLRAGSMLALLFAIGTVLVVNNLTMIAVLRLVTAKTFREVLQGARPTLIPGWVIGGGANLALGAMFVAAYDLGAWTTVFFAAPLALVHLGDRGYADLAVEQTRLAGLQQATHALAEPVNPLHAITAFLAQVQSSFVAERVEVHLWNHGELKVYALPLDQPAPDVRDGPSLAELILQRGEMVRIDRKCQDPELLAQFEREGWRDCLAVPLVIENEVAGILCTYNRTGVEGFRSGELAVLDALGRELSGALGKIRLLDQIMEEREKLSQIVGHTSDGIATIGMDGTVESWNPAMAEITRYAAERMIGKPRLSDLQPRDEADAEVALERWHEIDKLPETIQIVTAAGETRWLSCAYSKVEATTERPGCCIVVARDITNTHELDRMKDEFVSMVSHELRTPLTPILGWATTLLEAGSRLSPEQQREGYQAILRQGQRLRDLIFNLLETSKIETGNMPSKLGMFDVGQLAKRVLHETVESWPSREIRLNLTPDLRMASGDEWFVERILANMLSNAIKYSPPELPIDINVTPRAGGIDLSVADGGPGIPRYLHDQVFERFARFSSDSTQAGSGLGLYIAKRLANHMGSQISLDSDEGRGSTFTLHLHTAPALASVH